MIFKEIDFLSPPVTFYHKGSLSHSSVISGLLSALAFLVILAFGIFYSLDLIKHRNPTAFFFNRFTEDAGYFPVNSSSFFHFISIKLDESIDKEEGIDFSIFRIIGIEKYFTTYLTNRNLTLYDHWVYGLCEEEKDLQGIENVVKPDFFNRSACIRKYFNSTTQKYYDIGDENFQWPKMAHGTYNPDSKFYNIFVEKCQENTRKLIFGENSKCRNDSQINEIIGMGAITHFYFIDQYIDVFNYNEPLRKYFYRIENKLEKNVYTTNHLNFNPSLLVTHKGVIFDKIEEIMSYYYDRNDAFVGKEADDIYMDYYLWLNNRIQFFERTFKKMQDVFSDIGGISKFITFVAVFINQFYNNYIIFYDTKILLSTSITTQETEKNKKIIELKNIENNPQTLETNKSFTQARMCKDYIVSNTNLNNGNKNIGKENIVSENTNINNIININNDNEKTREDANEPNINDDTNNNKGVKQIIKDNDKRKRFNFWNYFVYKICCGKRNSKLKTYEDFRTKIISEEQLIKNHLNIYNLLKESEITEINKKQRNELKDLMRKGTILI